MEINLYTIAMATVYRFTPTGAARSEHFSKADFWSEHFFLQKMPDLSKKKHCGPKYCLTTHARQLRQVTTENKSQFLKKLQ